MKILVTGATGSLGSRLVESWAGRHEVTATGRQDLAPPGASRFLRGDLADPTFTADLVRGHEAVIHCAALASAWGPWRDFHRANVVATQNVADACAKHGVKRLVHISTPSIYFAARDRFNIRESEPLPEPVNNYARSKLLAEHIVRGMRGPEWVILRPRGIFGPTDRVILPKILRLLRRGRFPLVRGGRAQIDLTHVDNVLQAIDLALDAPGVNGETFNVSNGEPITVKEMVTLISEHLDLRVRMIPLPLPFATALAAASELAWKLTGAAGEPPLTRYGIGLLSFAQTLDLGAAKDKLGYAPRVKLREGILSTLGALR